MKKEQKGAAKKHVTENKKSENYCKFCDLIISKPSNYKRHLKTAKHLKNMQHYCIKKKKEPKRSKNEKINCSCGRIFKTRSGL